MSFESFDSVQICAWTEERLLSTLLQFLAYMPTSVSILFFADGLDEFVEDEDNFIETIRRLNYTPQVRVCVSSRPEQIFRRGFSASPQLRLQDFNQKDIEKAATDKLFPSLTQQFLQDNEEVDHLIKNVVHKAQGVFLWLELMAKDLKKGVHNGDTLPELHTRLETTPDTIEGLYEHMLSRLDKSYLQEAIRYFHFLMAPLDHYWRVPVTLLEFVCAEDVPWEYVRRRDHSYFESPEFHNICQNAETRILTRCAGLIEIGKHRLDYFQGVLKQDEQGYHVKVKTAQDEHNVSRHLRRVEFIHRTVSDFSQSHHQTFFEDSGWRSAAMLAIARGELGLMSIVPIATPSRRTGDRIVLHELISDVMETLVLLDGIEFTEATDLAFDDVVVEMVDLTYLTISHVDTCLNGPGLPWYEHRSAGGGWTERLPFHDVLGFAAYYGCGKYVSRHITFHSTSREELDYLLACTTIGMKLAHGYRLLLIMYFTIVDELLGQGADPNLSVEPMFYGFSKHCYHSSPWTLFFEETTAIAKDLGLWESFPMLLLCNTLIELFISRGANLDIGIFLQESVILEDSSISYVYFTLEESSLSYYERHFSLKDIESLKTLSDSPGSHIALLRSHGVLQRRRIHTMNKDARESHIWYQLSQKQSDRLCEVWPLDHTRSEEELASDREAYHRVLEEIGASLTEADLVDPSNIILRTFSCQNKTDVVKEISELEI